MFWNIRIDTLLYSLEQLLHVLRGKWRTKGSKLIHDATKRPYVTLGRVRFVLPYFRWTVIRRASLSLHNPLLCDLGNIHVAQFDFVVLGEKDIC